MGFLITLIANCAQVTPPLAGKSRLLTNSEWVTGLTNCIDLTDVKQVFRYVFQQLPAEATVYPTENYYYFQLPVQGRIMWGSLCLSPQKRAKGILQFSYIEKRSNPKDSDRDVAGGFADFSERDGLRLKRLDRFTYAAEFEGNRVLFKLNVMDLSSPKRARLLSDEVYIGPVFDESGLRFFLLFNQTVRHFYWILNEDVFVSETFTALDTNVVCGNRTDFLFYLDSTHQRKILVGVKAANVLANNWYDGPFDQMPDNYIEGREVQIKPFLLQWRPYLQGRIDDYGFYLNQVGIRVPLATYCIYGNVNEVLSLVQSNANLKTSESEFYFHITQHLFNTRAE